MANTLGMITENDIFDAVVFDENGKPHYFVFKKFLWWTKAVEVYAEA